VLEKNAILSNDSSSWYALKDRGLKIASLAASCQDNIAFPSLTVCSYLGWRICMVVTGSTTLRSAGPG